jgi:hypothetical protein
VSEVRPKMTLLLASRNTRKSLISVVASWNLLSRKIINFWVKGEISSVANCGEVLKPPSNFLFSSTFFVSSRRRLRGKQGKELKVCREILDHKSSCVWQFKMNGAQDISSPDDFWQRFEKTPHCYLTYKFCCFFFYPFSPLPLLNEPSFSKKGK